MNKRRELAIRLNALHSVRRRLAHELELHAATRSPVMLRQPEEERAELRAWYRAGHAFINGSICDAIIEIHELNAARPRKKAA